MTPKVALVELGTEGRARERFARRKRLQWSILNWQGTRDDIGKMLDLLEEALAKTDDELAQLERQLGYHIRDKEEL